MSKELEQMIDKEIKEIEAEHIECGDVLGINEEKQSFGICKATEINEDERSVTAIISTDSVDRDDEVLIPKGMDADNFRKNPVVPWSHRSDQPPVGKALWLKMIPKRNPNRIAAKVKFANTDRAEEVWQLFKGGFLNAFSVGFKPKEGRRPTPDDVKANPVLADARFMFTKWELLEFSPVTVPANADALAQAIKSKALRLSDELIKELHVKEAEDEEEVLLCAADFKENKINVEIPVDIVYDVEQ